MIKSIKLYLYINFLLFSFCSITNAQKNAEIKAITTEDGLSQGMIYDILQDREGFLWIATKDGLNRYDGYQFKVFTNDPNDPWSISGNTIIKLFEDSAGRIWAASDNAGMNIYDKNTGRFHHLRHDPNNPASLSGNYISAIVEDTSGYFITAVDKREINMFRLQDDFFNTQQDPQIIRVSMPPQEQIRKLSTDGFMGDFTELQGLAKDAKDRIWVGGNDAIFQLNVHKAQMTLAKEGSSFNRAHPNPNGSSWVLSGMHRLAYWDGVEAFPFSNDPDLMTDMTVDKKSNLWVISTQRLYGFDLNDWKQDATISWNDAPTFYQWSPNDVQRAIPHPLSSLTVDRSGVIWLGTTGYGLYRINPDHGLFSHQFSGISVKNIIEGSDNRLYLQDFSNQWFNSDRSCFEDVDISYPYGCFPGDILKSKSGNFWIKFFDRYNIDNENYPYTFRKYDPLTQQSERYEISWHYDEFQPMIECHDATVWMAGYNDLLGQFDPASGDIISYDLKTGTRIQLKEEEAKSSVDYSTALYEDDDRNIWVGTETGFTKCLVPQQKGDDLQITHYENIPGDLTSLSYNHVTCFLADPNQPDRFLWVSTKGGGLNRLDKTTGTFIHLTKNDGLPDDVVYGILPDDNGNIWGSTNKGLFCMSVNKEARDDKSKSYIFRNFSKADGLQENEFNTGAYKKLSDGRLAFGGINGYNVFDPKSILSDDYSPPTYITNILVNNQAVSPDDGSEVLNNTIETTKKITLSHQDRILTLEFASLDYNDPERNKYRYQLLGADDTWVEAGSRRSATFLNLQPNEYTFRVQGTNSQGIWSDHIAELQISILPPWWKTWWAYLLYAALIIAGIGIYFRFSINRAKLKQQVLYEKRETDRVKDLDALKTQLYMNMTHEFRTPLTIILGMAKQMQDDPKEHFSSGLNMIIRNGQNLLNLVNKMLNLSKLESGKMSLQMVQGDIVSYLRNIVESFKSFASNKEIQLHFLPEVDLLMMDFDADKLQQVVSNLISNAFKFTPEGGHIYFNIRKESDSSLAIRVKDTGAGIPQEDLEKVFDRFYQVDNSTTRRFEGSGIGLALSKELVTLMEGTISAQSPPIGAKKGSEFMVVLPIAKQAQFDKTISGLVIPDKTKISKSQEKVVANGIVRDIVKEANNSATKSAETQSLAETKIPLILITEDNEDVAAYIASCLPDYRLAIAENGQEGFEIATELIPDLIISDVMMPIMDGFEFCQKLKLDNRTDHIPVIMLTARADTDSKLEGLELGANVYLPKPFEKQELLLTIKNLFDLRERLRRHHQNIAGLVESVEIEQDVSNEPKSEDAFVIKVRTLIESHVDNFDLNVESLAKELHLSHSQFGRKLDALTGYTPNRFIRFIRLKKAKELLLNQNLSITAVAYESGFSDPSYFTRVFKKEFGKTPIEWRLIDTP